MPRTPCRTPLSSRQPDSTGCANPAGSRAWLYAVARNEALRILASKQGTSALDEAPEVTDDSVGLDLGLGHDAERADLRALLEDASHGLNPGDREVVELQLRQGLDPAEIATVLGVSRSHAHTLLSRAGKQLGRCLAVLLVGRACREDCGKLDAILAGWDGRLTVLLRKRVHRHIEHCVICGARRAFQLRPGMLLDLPSGAALAAGAELSFRLAAGPPEGLRAHTITIAAGLGPGAVAHRMVVLSRAGAFNRSGFPKPAHRGKAALGGRAVGVQEALRSSPRGQATAAAAVFVAVAIASVAFVLTNNSGTSKSAADPKPPVVPAGAITSPAAKQTQPKPTTHATSAAPTTPPAASASSSSAKPGQKSMSITSASTPTPASPSPTTRSAASPTPSPTPTPTPTPTPGTLSEGPQGGTAAAPKRLVLVPSGAGKQIDLSASGSGDWNVGWSVSVANDSGGAVSVSPAHSGTLTPTDPTTTLTVTANQFIACGSSSSPTITVEPGGAVYSVCTSLL